MTCGSSCVASNADGPAVGGDGKLISDLHLFIVRVFRAGDWKGGFDGVDGESMDVFCCGQWRRDGRGCVEER